MAIDTLAGNRYIDGILIIPLAIHILQDIGVTTVDPSVNQQRSSNIDGS